MTLSQDIHLLQILKEEAKIELPVTAGMGHSEYRAEIIEDGGGVLLISEGGGQTKEQAKYIAHLLNIAPAMLGEIERLRRENKSYRNYIASAPDHGVVDHE